MNNIFEISKSKGFTRMDNDLYEALIAADLSGRELRVALAIHRLTAGYNVLEARVYAGGIAEMSGIARENVSRMVSELLRQRVIYRNGGSKSPIGFNHPDLWIIDTKVEPKKGKEQTTQCVKSDTSLVSFPTHYKDINTKPSTNVLVAAEAATPQSESQPEPQSTIGPEKRQDKIPYQQIADLYNRICGSVLPACLKLNDKRRANIRKCWNLEIAGEKPFRDMDGWEGYFNDCLQSRHWTGHNDRNWRASLEFLTREENVLRVLEGQA
tara:strand:+ start:18708 stop:19511 length:804 start_codon:yes stop_codon:yes gene_type:complete